MSSPLDNVDEERRSHEAAAQDIRYDDLAAAVKELLGACDMEDHNQAIFSGKWKPGSKAWSGEYIHKVRSAAIAKLRAILAKHDAR